MKKEKAKKQNSEEKNAIPKKRGRGAPTDYTEEWGKKICELVATHAIGYHSLRRMYPELPAQITINEWKLKHKGFADRYLQAKKFQSEILVEEIDNLLPEDIKTYVDDKGNERYDSPSASMMIAKINNRKWMAARLSPKVYGEQKQIESLEVQNESLRAELRELREQLDQKNKQDY